MRIIILSAIVTAGAAMATIGALGGEHVALWEYLVAFWCAVVMSWCWALASAQKTEGEPRVEASLLEKEEGQ